MPAGQSLRRRLVALLALTLFTSLTLPVIGTWWQAIAEAQRREKLVLRVANAGWGDVPSANIQAVLASAGGELLRYFPDPQLDPIIVEPGAGDPIVLFARGPAREYIVQLQARETFWARFAYQFAHELTHILGNYDGPARPGAANRWFGEVLGETGSLFALKRMAEAWKTAPPYPNWREYAASLSKYASDNIDDSRRRLPAGLTLGQWFAMHRHELAADATNRTLNAVVANELLPMFEADPRQWDSITYLNLTPPRSGSFEDYLAAWRDDVSSRHTAFVSSIIGRFR